MPLTSRLATGEVLDSTTCSDEDWERVHRARPRVELTCRGCDGSMHAKRSRRGLRFFAHDQLREDCPSAGETAEHLLLKATIAGFVRDAGWQPIIEATPTTDDVGGWRADVLAVGPAGDRVALEAQLAPMTTAVGEQRTATYAADGIRTLWFTTKNAPWLYEIPGVKVVQETSGNDSESERLIATRGCVQLDRGSGGELHWLIRTDLDAARLVDGYLNGRSVAHRIGHLWDTYVAGSQPRYDSHTDAVAIVPSAHVDEIERRRLLRERERRRRQAEQDRWAAQRDYREPDAGGGCRCSRANKGQWRRRRRLRAPSALMRHCIIWVETFMTSAASSTVRPRLRRRITACSGTNRTEPK